MSDSTVAVANGETTAQYAALAHEERPIALETIGVRKQFPGVLAVDDASIRIRAGEIHALVGENGAGKTTLIKVITGNYRPDAGQLLVNGQEVSFRSARDALQAGIAAVHQERNLVNRFTGGENIMLEDIPRRARFFVDTGRMREEARRGLERLEVNVDVDVPVIELSVAQRQLVEVARALSHKSSILLLDEPTASITPTETAVLFRVLRRLRDQGVAIVFVSHKLEEIFALCDRVTVLRDGRVVGNDQRISEMTRDQLVTQMIGRAEVVAALPERPSHQPKEVLACRGLVNETGAHGVDLAVHAGEIVGLYGLVGAGRSETARTIIGIDKLVAGEILVDGQPVRIRDPRQALERYGIGYVSENRKEEGLLLIHSVSANVSITVWRRLAGLLGWLRVRAVEEAVVPYVKRLDIKTPSLSTPVATLSGGNQQKVSVAKWLAARSRVLIIDEPTAGIDVRTKGYLHELIWELASQGLGILLISSDMPEIVRLADRLLVMNRGRVEGEIENTHDYTTMSERIMSYIHVGENGRTAAGSGAT
jgi:ribose transport system ATP-binding protein